MTELEILKTRVPINALTADNFKTLASKTKIEKLPAGQKLFDIGDTDNQTIYLLSGEVLLKPESGKERVIQSDTDAARYALAQLKPRQFTGVAATEAVIARVDGDLLDRLLAMEQAAQASGGMEVVEFDGAQDPEWIMRLLSNEAFQRLPPSNINAMFARMEPVEVKANQIVIRQGDPGDYYYLIKNGRASVSRKTEAGKVVVLVELGEGQGVGEDALLSGAPRNATVMMLTDGVLMRLAKKDFDELLREPMVQSVTQPEAVEMVRAGAALIDVRLEDEHQRGAIKGSVNMPLYLLRLKVASLDPKRKYIVYCQTGSRSTAAAFLLSQRGFDVYVLRGGLNALARAA